MTSLLLLSLLCPDTAYYNEPFTVHIHSEPAPPGATQPPSPDGWGMTGHTVEDGKLIASYGFIAKGADSFTALFHGPGDPPWPGDGATLYVGVGSFVQPKNEFVYISGASCTTIMRARNVSIMRVRKGRLGLKSLNRFRLDGRFAK